MKGGDGLRILVPIVYVEPAVVCTSWFAGNAMRSTLHLKPADYFSSFTYLCGCGSWSLVEERDGSAVTPKPISIKCSPRHNAPLIFILRRTSII